MSFFLRHGATYDLRDGKHSHMVTWTLTSDGSFGAWLKRHREASGASLEGMRWETRIPVRLLEAIEADRFDQLPGGLYTRNFLRQYARSVGLTPEEVLRTFDFPRNRAAPIAGVPFLVPLEHVRLIAFVAGPSRAKTLGLRFAAGVFRILEALLPERITREELGDASEYMSAPERNAVQVWAKTISTAIWVTLNAWRDLSSIVGRQKP